MFLGNTNSPLFKKIGRVHTHTHVQLYMLRYTGGSQNLQVPVLLIIASKDGIWTIRLGGRHIFKLSHLVGFNGLILLTMT